MLQVVETLSYEKRKTRTRLSHTAADWNSYNTVGRFSFNVQQFSVETLQLARRGDIWRFFGEFIVWFFLQFSLCALDNIVLNWTVL